MKEGWEYKKLGEVCESDLGKTLNQAKDTGNLRPYLCAVNIQWDKIDLTTLKQTKFEDSELERYTVRKGDLLVCEGGDIGRAAIWDKEEPILYQNALHRIRFNGEVLSRFCLLYLHSLKQNGILDNRYAKGVTILHLVKSSLLSIPIPVPTIEEQQQVVSELDLLSGVIEKQKAQLEELDKLAQSIFYDMFGDPVTNEKGWKIKLLGELYDIGSSKRVFENQWTDNGVPFYRAREIVRLSANMPLESPIYISEELYRDYSQKYGIPSEGDILVTAVGTLGVCYIVKKNDRFYYKDGNLLCLKNLGFCHSKFTYALFQTDFIKFQINGNANAAVVGTFTITNAKKMKVIYPPLSLQQEFAAKVEAIEAMKAKVRQSLKEAETLFNERMDYYFN